LYVDASFTSMPQLVNKSNTFCLDPYTCAEANLFHPITCAQDELKFMSSLNTFGYIEFDILCDLKCLEKKLFAYSEFSYLSNHTYHFIGKYNCKRQYLAHKHYICSNLKYLFRLQYNDKIGGCINTNNILQSPSCFSLMQLGQPKEGENSWLALSSVLLPCYSNIKTSTFGFLRSKSEDDLQPRRGE
jgi:hypothetical protein